MMSAELDLWLRGLPGVTVDIKWGADHVYSVGGRMFAVCDADSGAQAQLSFKVPDEAFLAWTEQPGIRPAPYLARAHWVQLTAPWVLQGEQLQAALLESWRLVCARLTRKLRTELGISTV